MKLFIILTCTLLHVKVYWTVSKEAQIDYAPKVVFQLNRHGLASNFIHLLAYKSHVESLKHEFVVDEAHYQYMYKNQGVMTAFFEPTSLILKDEDEFRNYVRGNEGVSVITTTSSNGVNRRKIRSTYSVTGLPYYQWMSKEACSTLRFSKIGLQRMNELTKQNNIPSFLNTASVGFHVRRGDKTQHESRLFKGEEYVNKLLEITNETEKNVENCFIASDDYIGLLDVKKALKKGNVPCKVYSLVNRSQKGSKVGSRTDYEVLQFITELSVLIETTYFIGSFDSNVGSLVSMMRSCGRKDKSHFSQSYSVSRKDVPYWR